MQTNNKVAIKKKMRPDFMPSFPAMAPKTCMIIWNKK